MKKEDLISKGFNENQANAIVSEDLVAVAREIAYSSGCIDDYVQYFALQKMDNAIKEAQTEIYKDEEEIEKTR